MIDIDKIDLETYEFTGEELGNLLLESVKQMKRGEFTRTTTISSQIRKQANLSQNQFANAIGISVSTLKSWEQGQRKPSGSAKVLLNLLAKHPELIDELATTTP